MATATINWVPVNGGTYEIWYGKLTVVGNTSEPPTAGWTQATGSPFSSTLGTATITGLDDNTRYRVDARSDCSPTDSVWLDYIRYKLVCPSFSVVANPSDSNPGASITATITLTNTLEFEQIATTLTLVVTKHGDSTPTVTHTFTAPYTDTLSFTFSSLLNLTQYDVTLNIHDSVANIDVACGSHSVTTPSPVIVPPPFCTSPTFTIGNITRTGADITITSSISTGDTFDVSVDGGLTYTFTGISVFPFTMFGLTSGNSYQVVVRRNCGAGGSNTSTSQTFTTLNSLITGSFSMNSNTNTVGNFQQGSLYLIFNFPTPTPFPITLYFGYTRWGDPAKNCKMSNGYQLFIPPAGAQNCAGSPTGDTFMGNPPSSPFQVVIPQGVTSFNTGTNIRSIGGPTPDPWINTGQYTDVYVRAISPTGYAANFTITNGVNIGGVILHNV